PSAQELSFGPSFDFGHELPDLEEERGVQPDFQLGEGATRATVATRAQAPATLAQPNWSSGRAVQAAELEIDPRQLAILADYGERPESAAHSLAYAYRVFTRQRQLKRELLPIAAEAERARLEQETTLAEFSQAVRPALEQIQEFGRFLAPLLEIEQRNAARGQALTSINAQLGAEQAGLDAELGLLKTQIEGQQRLESEAQRRRDERQANAQRADAKLKRVQIEMRAVMHVAEQKLGAQTGAIPEPEASQLRTLEQRQEALGPEVAAARGELEQAKQALTEQHARLAALRQSERQMTRKKQALGAAYGQEISARSQGVSEAELEQRAALAELGRAVLAAPGTLAIPEAWLGRVRNVGERAAALGARAEMYRRAIAAYDAPRARQGVRLACTAVGLLLVLFAFKLIF
ncbi:MAG TPA: hypothetical protein VGC79_03895, partial [Polyangiaceae bacterium]